MDSVLPRISSGSDHVYNYMSQNISILLVAATTFVFVLWCFRIVRSFLASTSFLVSLHNETAIQLEDYEDEEVGLGLIPSANDFTQLLRNLTAQRFPPLRVEAIDIPCFIHKSSIRLISHPSEEEPEGEGQFTLQFLVDAQEPTHITTYWGVSKEEVIQLLSSTPEQEDDSVGDLPTSTEKSKHSPTGKGFLWEWMTKRWRPTEEKLLDQTDEEMEELAVVKPPRTSAQQRHQMGHQSLWFPRADQKNMVDVPSGMSQEVTFPEKDSVDRHLLATYSRSEESEQRVPLVITLSAGDHSNGGVLLLIMELRALEEEQSFSISDHCQFLVTPEHVHYLEDVYGQDDREECVVCLTDPKDTTILPCHHFAVCHDCFGKITTCPICRAKISAFVRFVSDSTSEEVVNPVEAEIEVLPVEDSSLDANNV